jgi:polyribonucleotide nucleotidyltransferase
MKQTATVELAGGKTLEIETGHLAKQAQGSAIVRQGDNVVLGTACASPDPREGTEIPFHGPVGAVRVGFVNDEYIVNPTYDQMRDSLINIMVVGTAEGIVMVESGAKEVSEEQVLGAIEFAHEQIKKICAAISDLAAKVGKKKIEVKAPEFDQAYYDQLMKKVGPN